MTGPVAAAGFTLVLCGAEGCSSPLYEPLRAELARVVGVSRFGILVVSGCTLGGVPCRLRTPAPMIAVQPCDTQRRPIGSVIRVGPLRTGEDIATLARWLRRGRLDIDDLPDGMMATHRAMGAAIAN